MKDLHLTTAEVRSLFGVQQNVWERELAPKLVPCHITRTTPGRPTLRYRASDVATLFEKVYGRPPTVSEIRAAVDRVERHRQSSRDYARSKRLDTWYPRRRLRKRLDTTAFGPNPLAEQWTAAPGDAE